MRKLPIAAAALLLGTSAYAMVPTSEPTGVMAQKEPYTVQPSGSFAPVADEGTAVTPAAVDWWDADAPAAYAPDKGDPMLKPAMATTYDPKAEATDPAYTADDWAAAAAYKAAREGTMGDAKVDKTADAKLTDATADDMATVEPATMVTGFSDAGADSAARVETIDTASADLAPRAAAQNYPACRPGPGDDHCIQLYEPGVRAELASWTQPTGGFAGTADTRMAMDDSATETERLNRQALADSNAAIQMASADDVVVPDDAVTDDKDVGEV